MAIVDAITREAHQQGIGGALYVEALGTQLAVQLLRRYACVTSRDSVAGGRLSRGQVGRLLEYIEARLNEPISLDDLATVVEMGVCTFSRHFRETLGRAPHAFVIDRRVERAKRLLSQGDLAVKEVASSCGFADQAHLTRVFRCRLGTTPAQLRRESRDEIHSGARAPRATGCGHRAHVFVQRIARFVQNSRPHYAYGPDILRAFPWGYASPSRRAPSAPLSTRLRRRP